MTPTLDLPSYASPRGVTQSPAVSALEEGMRRPERLSASSRAGASAHGENLFQMTDRRNGSYWSSWLGSEFCGAVGDERTSRDRIEAQLRGIA